MSHIDLVLRDEDLAKEEGRPLGHNNCGDELMLKWVKSTQVVGQVILLKCGHCFAEKKSIEPEYLLQGAQLPEHNLLRVMRINREC
jgi:hypothetical protein